MKVFQNRLVVVPCEEWRTPSLSKEVYKIPRRCLVIRLKCWVPCLETQNSDFLKGCFVTLSCCPDGDLWPWSGRFLRPDPKCLNYMFIFKKSWTSWSIPSLKLTARPWKSTILMVFTRKDWGFHGRAVSFREGIFSYFGYQVPGVFGKGGLLELSKTWCIAYGIMKHQRRSLASTVCIIYIYTVYISKCIHVCTA